MVEYSYDETKKKLRRMHVRQTFPQYLEERECADAARKKERKKGRIRLNEPVVAIGRVHVRFEYLVLKLRRRFH